jgi:hypothetical protein
MPLLRETCTWVGPPANLTSYLPSCQIDLADRATMLWRGCRTALAQSTWTLAIATLRTQYEAPYSLPHVCDYEPNCSYPWRACTLLVTPHLFQDGRTFSLARDMEAFFPAATPKRPHPKISQR